MKKLTELIKAKEKELKVQLSSTFFDEQGNVHVMCKKLSNKSYVVWTSYYTGEAETSYENFYNGKYGLDYEQALDEAKRRVLKGRIMIG